jgi:hypothetical protein
MTVSGIAVVIPQRASQLGDFVYCKVTKFCDIGTLLCGGDAKFVMIRTFLRLGFHNTPVEVFNLG